MTVTVPWQFVLAQAEARVIFNKARPNARGAWIEDVWRLPPYVRAGLHLEQERGCIYRISGATDVGGAKSLWPEATWMTPRLPTFAYGVVMLDAPVPTVGELQRLMVGRPPDEGMAAVLDRLDSVQVILATVRAALIRGVRTDPCRCPLAVLLALVGEPVNVAAMVSHEGLDVYQGNVGTELPAHGELRRFISGFDDGRWPDLIAKGGADVPVPDLRAGATGRVSILRRSAEGGR
jgi:hypothetical protein